MCLHEGFDETHDSRVGVGGSKKIYLYRWNKGGIDEILNANMFFDAEILQVLLRVGGRSLASFMPKDFYFCIRILQIEAGEVGF